MKVVFFGAGGFARHVWKGRLKSPHIYQEECLAYTDNNPQLWGKDFLGQKVVPPSDIKNLEIDLVVITSNYLDSIRRQLIEELGVLEEKIYSYSEYSRKCYAEYRYQEKYKSAYSRRRQQILGSDKVVVYTAITGNYDVLKDPVFLSNDLTYVCITDDPDLRSEIWNIEYVDEKERDGLRLDKYAKLNPQYFFGDYEMSIWVDGKFQILKDLRTYVSRYKGESGMLCFPHPQRNCIYDEAAACIMYQRGNKRDILRQISDYLAEGYPFDYGLYEMGCIVRFHQDDKVRFLMKKWEDEIKKYSMRDQLSFPYLCWKNEFSPDISDLDINKNRWLINRGHVDEV